MPETTDDELVPVLLVGYERPRELEITNDEDGAYVSNHDEMVNSGKTFDEIRALSRSAADEAGFDVIEPGDALWDERFEDLDSGQSWRVEELRD